MSRSSCSDTARAGESRETLSCASAPAMTSSISAASRTVRVIGPTVSCVGHSSTSPLRLIRPRVVFNPTTPHRPAGMRTEPPVSVPIAAVARPAATATAEPLLEPPGTRCTARSHGFHGVPMTALVPQPPNAYSTVCVLPITTAPEARSRATTVALAAETLGGTAREPAPSGWPAISNRSLTATVTPCSGPSRMPAASIWSSERAAWRASSA